MLRASPQYKWVFLKYKRQKRGKMRFAFLFNDCFLTLQEKKKIWN